jgi:hypothetical protein
MALPVNRPINEVVTAVATLPDLSTASSTYAVATHRGRIKRAYSVIQNAITTANGTWTIKVRAGSALRTATVLTAGSAAGDVDSVELGYMGTENFVNEGDLITFTSSGACDTTCITRFYAVIERAN